MALVRNPEHEAPATPERPGSEPEIPHRLLRSVESGSPPRPRERKQRVRWPDAIDVVFEKDPAALNIFEVLLYQGLHAIALHRVAHALYRARIPILPRLVSQVARLLTGGIEIHPGAKIGKRFFIDHGSGIVIGETAEVGNNVMLYHQVTLGATGWWKTMGPNRRVKRHPTIEDNVTIGVGASILGPVTIGRNSKIGAMALVLEDVPPDSVVVAKPAELLMLRGKPLPQHQELTQGWEPEYQI
ncbi:MAG TPA: serine O-acetyltransferase EpsC [Ktedonobacterales bacterium]|jgi:serine O-acetyltransferase